MPLCRDPSPTIRAHPRRRGVVGRMYLQSRPLCARSYAHIQRPQVSAPSPHKHPSAVDRAPVPTQPATEPVWLHNVEATERPKLSRWPHCHTPKSGGCNTLRAQSAAALRLTKPQDTHSLRKTTCQKPSNLTILGFIRRYPSRHSSIPHTLLREGMHPGR